MTIMKICLITARRDPTVRPLDYDGGGNHVFNYACQLAKKGHEIHIITQLERENITRNKEKAVIQSKLGGTYFFDKANNIHIHRIPYQPMNKAFKHEDYGFIRESSSFCKNLEVFYKSNKFDVYHYFHMFSVSGFISNNKKIPYRDKSIFSPLLPYLGRSYEKYIKCRVDLEKKIFKKIAYITYNSNSEKNIIIKRYGVSNEKMFSSLPGIDKKIFNPKNRKYYFSSDTYAIIYPNAIRPQKRQLFLIKALVKVQKNKPDFRFKFLIVGTVVDKSYFTKILNYLNKNQCKYEILRKNSNINKIVNTTSEFVFINGLEHKPLSKLIKSANLSVFPSLNETFGISLLETMACGTPIICYSLKAYNNFIIKNHNAITINRKSGIDSLHNKIIEVIENGDNTNVLLVKNAINQAIKFSWTNVVSNLANIYTQIGTIHANNNIVSQKDVKMISLNQYEKFITN